MAEFYTMLHAVILQVVNLATLFLETLGIVVIVYGAVRGFVEYWQQRPDMRLRLAQNMAVALEFKIGGEILRTVVARNWEDLLQLGAVIVLRAGLTLLIQWEIKNGEKYPLDLYHPPHSASLPQKKEDAPKDKQQKKETGRQHL